METADERTGHKVEKVPIAINSHEDFVQLRKVWAGMPMVPKIIHRHEAANLNRPNVDSRNLIWGEETGGTITVFDVYFEPGFAAGAHYQPNEDELLYIQEGQLELTIGNRTASVGPGSLGYAPRTATHAFKNVGTTRVHSLDWNAPAGHERSFEATKRMIPEGTIDNRELRLKSLANHEMIFPDGPAWGMGLADGKTPTADERTGRNVEKVPIVVNSHQDLMRLREIWSRMPRIPKLIHRDEAPELRLPGQRTRILLCGEETAGSVAFFDHYVEPGFGAPAHRKQDEEEFIYVVDGALELTIGTQTVIAGPATLGFAPRTTTRGYKVIGGKPCHLITWNAPAGHERALATMEQLARDGNADRSSMLKVAHDHKIIFSDR